jgi:hypothetical protein
MPTPNFNLRLPLADRAALDKTAERYGAPPGEFLRDLIGAFCAGDADRTAAFHSRLNASEMRELLSLRESIVSERGGAKPRVRIGRKKGRSRS